MKCVANNIEKYISFSVGGLRFIDSLAFLQGSLDSLLSVTPKKTLKITSTISEDSELLYKKGIFPYEYMNAWERFSETRLPDKEMFYSTLNNEHITDEEYAHAQRVWEVFGWKTLSDYHDQYVKADVTLLADDFENLPQPMLRAVRIRSGSLLYIASSELGRALKKAGMRAGAPDKHTNTSLRGKGNSEIREKIREGNQPAGTGL